MPSLTLGPGRITACWFVLRSISSLGGQAARADLIAHASRSSLRSGGLPVRDGVVLAVEGGFVAASPNRLALSELGAAALRLGTEDEPTPQVRRFLVTRLLLADPPAWVAYWQGDPHALQLVLPPSERKTLADSGLLPPPEDTDDLGSWAFWRALGRVPLVSETAESRKRLGDAGELLSLEYERRRLLGEGHESLADRVEWLSRQSDAYGFDVLSYRGGDGPDADVRIAIEVKSTSLPMATELHFFLSVHEWETAERLGDRYVVHVWTSVDPGPPPTARQVGPLLITPASIVGHLPNTPECEERCRWQSAEIFLPLSGQDAGATNML